MFSNEQWLANSGADFYNGVATTSFRMKPSVVLTDECDAPTSAKIMSFGGWVKRDKIGVYSNLFSGSLGGAGVPQSSLYFDTDDKLKSICYNGSAYVYDYRTTQLFRDTSAWYHIWLQIDTTDGTQADRFKLYVNGVRVTSLTTTVAIANGSPDIRGFNEDGITAYFGHTNASYGGNVYYSDFYFIDGLAVSPIDTVGEFKNGAFIPKEYTPSEFGNNGFHLKFDQVGVGTPSATTIGADSSLKNRHFASTVGTNAVASDCAMPDSPENNFATMNSLLFRVANGTQVYSEGNLKYGQPTANSWGFGITTLNVKSGKWYAELRCAGNTSVNAGVINVGHYGYHKFVSKQNPQNETGIWQLNMDGTATKTRFNNIHVSATYTGFGNGQILGILLNADDKELSFTVDGTLQTGVGSSGVVDISTGGSANDEWGFWGNTYYGGSETLTWNFGQDSSFLGTETATSNADANGNGTFHSAVPSGYLALCTSNLPEPTIGANSLTQADDYFNTVLYTGNATARSITGLDFQPDLTWIKARSATTQHTLVDSIRGTGNWLESNATAAEQTGGAPDAFNSDGFDLTTWGQVNGSGVTFVSWNWKANGGTTSSNTSGTITSTVQANTDAGFSIVSYTGNGTTGSTIGHGLNQTPELQIIARRDSTNYWMVTHKDVTAGSIMHLYSTLAAYGTSNAISLGTTVWTEAGGGGYSNVSGGTYVAYNFHSVEGYSKIGGYTGNGSTDGTFVALNFRPAYLLIKRTDSANNWGVWDTARDSHNAVIYELVPNASDAETTAAGDRLDILSNGFKLRNTGVAYNASGGTYIYMAFAESPFKYANAR